MASNHYFLPSPRSFPYFHDARKSSNDQPVHRQRHIPHCHNQPPGQDETADHAADHEVQRKQGDPSTQGAVARHDPETHPMEVKRQSAEYPESYIVKLAVLHAGRFENTVQDQRHRRGQYAFEEKSFDCFASCHGKTSFRSFIIQDAKCCAQRLLRKIIPVHAAAVVPVPLERPAAHPHSV